MRQAPQEGGHLGSAVRALDARMRRGRELPDERLLDPPQEGPDMDRDRAGLLAQQHGLRRLGVAIGKVAGDGADRDEHGGHQGRGVRGVFPEERPPSRYPRARCRDRRDGAGFSWVRLSFRHAALDLLDPMSGPAWIQTTWVFYVLPAARAGVVGATT